MRVHKNPTIGAIGGAAILSAVVAFIALVTAKFELALVCFFVSTAMLYAAKRTNVRKENVHKKKQVDD